MMPNNPCDRQRGAVVQARGERLPHGRALGGRPWWIVAGALLLAALVGSGVAVAHALDRRADDLSEVRLVGPRSPNPISVVLMLDVSGSFAEYASLRQEALEQVIRWAPQNLRANDTLTIISFAESAELTMPTVTMGVLAGRAGSIDPQAVDGVDTLIVPPLEKAASAIPSSGGASIIVLTDTLVTDAVPAQVDPLLTALNATTMSVITPAGVDAIASWRESFLWEAEFHADADNPQQTALAVANALAHATGQRLDR